MMNWISPTADTGNTHNMKHFKYLIRILVGGGMNLFWERLTERYVYFLYITKILDAYLSQINQHALL